jgi:phospholipid/cholesterol/gamma-HCH transport system substrate-binding protein
VTKSRDALVGLVIVAAVVLTVAGTLWLQGARLGESRQELEAVFFQVGQIAPGNGVKLRGVQVGRVSGIAVEPNGQLVRVSLQLQEAVTLPANPVIILSPESFFGDWQAEIYAREDVPYDNFPVPPDASTLPGYALPDMSQLTATAQRIAENLGVLTDRFGIAFSEETARDIASLIDNVENVTTGLSELVEQQANSFAQVTDRVQSAADQIGSAADQVRTTFSDVSALLDRGEIDSTLDDLAAISANLRQLSTDLGGTNQQFRDMTARVDSTFDRVNSVMAKVESGDGTLGRLIQDGDMATDLEDTLSELSALLADIRENPNRYVRLSIF